MRHPYQLFLIFLLLSALAGSAQTGEVYRLEQDRRYGFLEKEERFQYGYSRIEAPLEVVVDAGAVLRFDSLRRLPDRAWRSPEAILPAPDWTAAVLWLRAPVTGDTLHDHTYAFQVGRGFASWRRIQVYALYPDGGLVEKRTGLDLPPGQKDVRDAFNFFTLPLPAGDTVQLFLRLDGVNSSKPPKAVDLLHVDIASMHEWNGYRVSSDYRSEFTPAYGKIIDYALRSAEILPDKQNGFGLQTILADSVWDRRAQFNRPSAFDPGRSYWLRQRLIGDTLQATYHTFMLGRDAAGTWTHANLYVPAPNGRLQRRQTGSKVSPAEKPVDDVHNLFEVFVPAGDTVTVYAYLESELPAFVPDNIHFSRFDRQAYEARGKNIRFWNALFQGALWIQFLYSILLFFIVREWRELYYAVLIIGMQLFFMSMQGYDLTLRQLLPTHPEWWHPLLNLGSFVAIFGLLKFSRQFLRLREKMPLAGIIINGYLFGLALCSLLVEILPGIWTAQVWRLVTGAGILMPLVFGGLVRLKGYRPAGIFLIAVTIFALSAFAHLFSFIIFPSGQGGEFTYVLFKVGVVTMLALMALGMGFRNLNLRKEKERALQQTLENQARINQRLLQLDHLKDQFLANTSHELRTPLNGIIGLAESLREGAAGELPETAREHLQMIAGSGRRLNNLINDILDFSKLKSRELTLRKQPVKLQAAAHAVLTLSQPLTKGKDLRLVNAVPGDAPPVLADENRLQQILHNLVGNALKFTETGVVEVGIVKETDEAAGGPAAGTQTGIRNPENPVSPPQPRLLVYVRDTGPGIPADKQQTIFRAFEQGDGSTARTYGGTGLGLAVTRQLVQLHGGRIWVESGEGEGATFYFTLPVAGEEGSVEKPPETPKTTKQPVLSAGLLEKELADGAERWETASGDASPDTATPEPAAAPVEPFHPLANRESEIRILVVDDEAVNRQVLQNQISLAGYVVTAASDGKEALELLFDGQRYDLVILDIMMPGMSGYEVCHRLRKHYLPSELPVIMLTAKNHIHDLVEGFEAGANDYLTKPFLREELLSRIRTHLHMSHINRATGRFVPHEFLRTLGKRDITDVSLGDHEQREVTVLFSDIRDYTTLAELMTPEDNFQFVNAYAGRMGPVIQQHGGFVQQYLGDAIMAIFQEHPQQALRAAVDMQLAIQRYNKERAQKGRRAIRAGMGLHTGSLIMGIIGDRHRTDAATIADTVNTASRLEGLTKHFGVNIILSEESCNRLYDPDDFQFRYLGRVQVKGKHQPVDIYECIDGDGADTMDRKLVTKDVFEDGLRRYYRKNFKAAVEAFEQVLARNAHDTAARLFRQRAAGYLNNGVPDDWTGVEAMRYK